MKKPPYLDLWEEIHRRVIRNGGWVNCHAHIDRAFTISKQNFKSVNAQLQEKWNLNDAIKLSSSVPQIYDRMAYTLDHMVRQGVQAIGTFIDVDEVSGNKNILAAERIKKTYKGAIKIKFINQTLKGVLNKEAKKWFAEGAGYADIVGGLAGSDGESEKAVKEHIEMVLSTAKSMGKMVHIHVDQLNSIKEEHTKILAEEMVSNKMEGRVVAIHCVSVGAHKRAYRENLYRLMRKVNLMVVSCPTAWIDSRRSEELVPNHNAVTPIEELIPHEIVVGLGTDNIADIYKPYSTGDLSTELRVILESSHYYNVDNLIKISTSNGLKILGL